MSSSVIINIVTAVLNDERGIQKTLASVRCQDYERINHIVIDGGSRDGTLAVVNRYRNGLARFVSEKDQGVYCAMNKGIAAAEEGLVMFINAGDLLHGRSVISEFVQRYYRGGDDALYLCAVLTDQGQLIEPRRIRLRRSYKLPVYHQGIIYPVCALRECPFDLRYRLVSDFHNYYQLSQRLESLPVPLVLCQFDTSGMSSTQTSALNREFIEAYRDLGIGFPSPHFRRLRLLLDR